MIHHALFGLVPATVSSEHVIPASTTWVFFGLLVAMILGLALEEKIHAKKSLITGIAAVVALGLGIAFHVIPGEVAFDVGAHAFKLPVYISGVDWGVIAIILGSSLFVDVTSRSGLFTWIAIKLTKASRGDPFILLAYYGVMTVVFSAVLNNVTAMIIVGSLTAVSLKKLERSEKLLGFLLIEGLLTNIGGLLTLISSVPNIIVGQTAGISFVTFFVKAAPFVVVATAITLVMGAKMFKIPRLKSDEEKAKAKEQVAGFDERDGIESQGFFNFAAVMLLLFIIALASTSTFDVPVMSALGMGFVAVTFGVIMLMRFKSSVDTFYAKLDWDLARVLRRAVHRHQRHGARRRAAHDRRLVDPHHRDAKARGLGGVARRVGRRVVGDRQHSARRDAREDLGRAQYADRFRPLVVCDLRRQPRRQPHTHRLSVDRGRGDHHAQARAENGLCDLHRSCAALRRGADRARRRLRPRVFGVSFG